MNETKPSQWAVRAAYAAAVLFAIHLVTYLTAPICDATATSSPQVAELLALLAVAEHLLVFPVAARLAPSWAKAAGYGWLVIDMTTNIVQLSGTPKPTSLAMRYGGALWIVSASWPRKGAMHVIGLLVGTLTLCSRAERWYAHWLGDGVPTGWAIFPSVFPLLSATLTPKTCMHLRREKKERFL